MTAPAIDTLDLEVEELVCEYRKCGASATHVLIPHTSQCDVSPYLICTPCISKSRSDLEITERGVECDLCGYITFSAADFVRFRSIT